MFERYDTGTIVSGAGHLGLIGWALVGGLLSSDPPPSAVANVTMVSGEEYAALVAQEPNPEGTLTPGPEVPDAPEAPDLPEAAETPEPPTPETPPETAEAPAPAEEARPDEAPDTSALEPLPEAEVTDTAPPEPTPPAAASEESPGASLVLDTSRRPKERPANRVAPTPAQPPEPDAAVDMEVAEAAEPVPAEEEAEPAEEQEATAPEAAATEIVTEADEPAGGEVVALAPAGSPRPKKRPAAPAPRNEPAASDAVADAVADAVSSAVSSAVSEAQSEGRTETREDSAPASSGASRPARGGPPLTAGEKDALRVAVQQCWNVGSLSTDALRVTVTVLVAMHEDGTPDTGSIRMTGSEGGSGDAVRQAFETARRAIIRCGARGFDLPREKYGQWAEIEMVFNPEKMRIK